MLLLAALAGSWLQTRQESSPATASVEVAAGRYDLARDEERGGHTLERHVGRSEADLIDRLAREREIGTASTYTDRDTAERIVGLTLANHRGRVGAWLARDAPRPNLALDYRGTEPIGLSVRRGARQSVVCTDATVVLRSAGRDGYFVPTSYPEPRR